MRTVLHIFLKDVRQMRWTLALWLALLAVQLNSALSDKQARLSDLGILQNAGDPNGIPVWTLLHWLGLVVVVFEVVLAERPFGTGPFWKTRPIARWQMATAKFLFIAGFTVLLPVLAELAVWHGQGISWRLTLGNSWLPLLEQAYVVSWMALLGAMCGRRRWEAIVLAVLALAAPFGMWALYGLAATLGNRILGVHGLWRTAWESPPDYLMTSPAFLLSTIFVMGCLPTVVLALAGAVAYVQPRRGRILQWLAVLTAIWLMTPLPLDMYRINSGRSYRDALVHSFTAREAALTLEWIAPLNTQARQSGAGLRATIRLPELHTTASPHAVMEGWYGFTFLRLVRAVPEEARGYQPHFSLPDQNPRRFGHHVPQLDSDPFINRALTRTNGLLASALGRHTALNPVTPASEPRVSLVWEADRPLTNFTHATPQWRVAMIESEVRIVGRQPFAEYRRLHPVTKAEPVEAADPRYTVTLRVSSLGLLDELGGVKDDWDTLAPRKAVLWHPQRRELLLPATSATHQVANFGVLALSTLLPVRVTSYANQFPHTPKGKEPQSGAPGPEWFAEAEVLLLAFKPVATRHHIIAVQGVPLPPVPSAPPKP